MQVNFRGLTDDLSPPAIALEKSLKPWVPKPTTYGNNWYGFNTYNTYNTYNRLQESDLQVD